MITKSVNLYRCEHCRKKKALRPEPIRRHEVNCFANPARTPYPGELAEVSGEVLFGGRSWWPGAPGQIFTGARWVPLVGYKVDSAGDETWPPVQPGWVDRLHGNHLPITKPWYLRLEMLGIPQERLSEQLRRGLFLDLEETASARIAAVTVGGDAVQVKIDDTGRVGGRLLSYRRGEIVRLASLTADREAAFGE